MDPAKQHQMALAIFTQLAKMVPGETTLNQLRVLQYIAMRSGAKETPACQSEICTALGLANTTVGRAISGFLQSGIIIERVDPRDSRRRLEVVNKAYPGLSQHVENINRMFGDETE